MILQTERLLLRPWKEGDAAECYKYASDPRVGSVAGWPAHTSVEESRRVIREVLSAWETYAIVWKETGLPIGCIGFHRNDLAEKEDEAELGYWLGVPYQGRGIVPEAARELLRHAFEDLCLARVWCGYYEGNERSRRVQEKLGFKHQWVTENVPVPQMGETRRGYVRLLTREEWTKANKRAVLYVHGKGGNAKEAEHYKPLFPRDDVIGFDYHATTPGEAKEEFSTFFHGLRGQYRGIILIANSIGAYFAMHANVGETIQKAYFISPIVDMEKLILGMMAQMCVTENELREKGVIRTDFGEDLSYAYLCYVREHPLVWNAPTEILCGGRDNLTSPETIAAFAARSHARVATMENGEHWFHTKEQMSFLDRWIRNCENR